MPGGDGWLHIHWGRIVGYWHDTVSDADCSLLGATRGDPAFQSEWELLAVWVSIETFLEILKKFSAVKIFLRTDNTATIQAAMEFRAGSPVMAQLAAEVSLQLAIHQLLPIYAQHVPGILNDLADRLSRLTPDDQVPEQLRQCQRFEPVQRTMKTFRAWPEVKCAKSWLALTFALFLFMCLALKAGAKIFDLMWHCGWFSGSSGAQHQSQSAGAHCNPLVVGKGWAVLASSGHCLGAFLQGWSMRVTIIIS